MPGITIRTTGETAIFSRLIDAADALCWPPPAAIGTRILVAR